MRKWNAIITAMILLLFVIHMIWGGLILIGSVQGGNSFFSCLSTILLILIGIHVLIGVKLTIDTVIAQKKSGVSYRKENRLFYIRRFSGLALMFFIAAHVFIFNGKTVNGVYFLHVFDVMALISQILMVVSLLVHILSNITPLRIALGFKDKGEFRTDLLFIFSILLLLAGMAFVVYFIRWLII